MSCAPGISILSPSAVEEARMLLADADVEVDPPKLKGPQPPFAETPNDVDKAVCLVLASRPLNSIVTSLARRKAVGYW